MCPETETDPPAQLLGSLAENPLQADENPLDDDSALGSSYGSASYQTTLASSVMNYKYENGRRYHAFREGSYLLPNDEEEQDRMDLVHHLYCLALGGKLFFAPIQDKPQRVLDLGTGTGIWAMDFADQYPSAQVIGTDLSPIQPKWTPPNCTFEVEDFEAEWLYEKPFDFIHGRELEGCISNDDQLFHRAFKHLAPGGYIEFQATNPGFLSDDDTAKDAVNAQLWLKHLVEGTAKFGKPMDGVFMWKEKLESIGFIDVQQLIYKVPVGAWAKDPKLKELGRFQGIQQVQAVESYTPALFARILGWTEEEIQVFIAKVKKDLTNPKIHLYIPVFFVWGRKPTAGNSE
ncbi:S-adenosyl-L-methionine-dependent methyltransferase [Ilyonectria robusta]|uniref:S-adenosyl-L-methionine-dependent methyltransferase n=1 Tax=Ilyonectria robusta TaxID=1079257 RepID=UPI001E8DDBD1|nr:S-adenosyl-L-methionine-dependent methyltransferase [Ilyonectria robusta]KAH8684983.1 S-adenosyl-L-methionine-dependent methyltransferase [Ilyonectria robusta]